jgi:hypothetical protein
MPEIWASTYNSSKHDGHHRGLINNGKQGERWHSTDGVWLLQTGCDGPGWALQRKDTHTPGGRVGMDTFAYTALAVRSNASCRQLQA